MSSVSLTQYLKYIWRVINDKLDTEHHVYLFLLIVFFALLSTTGLIKRDEIKRFTPEANERWKQRIEQTDECVYVREKKHKNILVCK